MTDADCTIYTLSVTANDGYVCDEGSGTLTANASGGGEDIYWYDAAVGGNLLGAELSLKLLILHKPLPFGPQKW